MKQVIRTGLLTAGLLLACGTALAHTGHAVTGMAAGLAHPLGIDHLLAMVAVGVWSALALPRGRAWLGPASFMTALVAGAALGATGVTVPYLEHAIAASVVLFGLMLVLATRRWPAVPGLALVAAAATLHGLAHGAEAPLSAGFGSYAAGFLMTTAALHVAGLSGGQALRHRLTNRATDIVGTLGLGLGAAGAYLLASL